MKKWFFRLVVIPIGMMVVMTLFAVAIGVYYAANDVSPKADIPKTVAVDNKKAKRLIKKLKGEPKIKDVMYEPQNVAQWTIGLIDDGSPRYGYAMYVCEEVREAGMMDSTKDTLVKTVDIVKVSRGEGFRNLGMVRCNDNKVINYGEGF